MNNDNPFIFSYNPNHFCDRKDELKRLESNFFNGINTMVHSARRLGKSFLIRHLFHNLDNENLVDTLYIDLFATQNMQDLIQRLADKVLQKYHQRNLLQGIQQLLKGLNPTISFDNDGTPKFSLDIQPRQYQASLDQIFEYLEKRDKKVLIAFDEFQEVANYPEKAEALLRTHIQQVTNIGFIFSGSTGHILREMFLGAKRPFYQSADVLVLGKINREIYSAFIISAYEMNGKLIENEAVEYILDFTEVHTYYTEMLCNLCYSQTETTLNAGLAKEIALNFLENRKFDYLNILNLMSENQKKLVTAIAKEGTVPKPNAAEFQRKHKLPTPSSINQALRVLLDREILFQTLEGYKVYDVFFSRFLEKYY